jgi:hypothetical protein
MSSSPSDSSKANVVAFLNPFVGASAIPRLEILVDWRDAAAWNNALETSIQFEIYAVKADQPVQYASDDTAHLGTPVLTSVDLTPSLPEKDIAVIRKRVEGYLHLSSILSQYSFPTSDRLASIARAADLSAFAPQKAGAAGKWESEPIRVPHPPEFHLDNEGSSQLLLAHAAHLRVWNENVVTRYIEAEKDPKLRILTTGTGGVPPVLEALRNAARNEPTFGRILNVLYYFEISAAGFKRLRGAKSDFLWLYARPANLSITGPDLVLVPTRLVVDAKGGGTYLEQDAETRTGMSVNDVIAAYQPNKVTAHQLISSEVFETLPPTDHRHLIYTKRTKATVHTHIAQLKQWSRTEDDGSIAQFLRFKTPTDAITFKTKCLDSIETDVQSIYNVDRPYDSIGIVWDQNQTVPTQNVSAAHVGYKGFRIDRITDKGSDSTCKVEKRLLFPSGHDIDLAESDLLGPVEGYVPVDNQNDPTIGAYKADTSAKEIELVVPRQFLVFDGYNSTAVNPLDQLLSTTSEDIVANAADPIVVLSNVSRTGRMLKYGDEIGFGVRKVAMTGLSPACDVKVNLKTLPASQHDPIFSFQRFVPIQEPAVKLGLQDLITLGEAGNGTDQSTNVYQVDGPSPKLKIEAQYPLAHYKLALQAATDIGDIGDDFNAACKSFVFRNEQKIDSSGFLRAFDPHASSVDVVSQVWYPFKANPSKGRQLATGKSSRSTKIGRLSFSDLVVKAQRMLADEVYPEAFDLPAMMPGNYQPQVGSKDLPDPQIFVGLRNRIQCRAGFDSDPVNPQLSPEVFPKAPLENPKITRAWTLNPVVHPSGKQFPIGGTVSPKDAAKKMTSSVSNYASIATARLERYLIVPPSQQATTGSADSVSEPARGTPFQWRKRLMPIPYVSGADKNIYYSSNQQAFDKYFAFISANVLKGDYGGSGPSASPVISAKNPTNGDYTMVANWSGANREMVIPGFHFPRPITVEEIPPDTSHEIAYRASLGDLLASSRHLPFVDDDIVWTVRLQWRVDLAKAEIPRGYELAAVKEFCIYRTEGTNIDLSKLPAPIATLLVPSRQALNRYDLDQVWWVMFDAITDREKHDYKYHVVAFPQDGAIFSTNEWFEISVPLPCSEFDLQPERLVPLPLAADPDRGFAFVFNVPAEMDVEARKKLKVAVRIAQSVGDPLLATDNSAKALESDRTEFNEGNAVNLALLKACSDPTGLPAALDLIFPNLASAYIQENGFPKNPFADGTGADPQSMDGWTWVNGPLYLPNKGNKLVFSHVLPAMDAQKSPTKNPFLKFHIAYFNPENYPRLRHTTGSDFILSDWVQAFPGDLIVEETTAPAGLRVKNAWGASPAAGASKHEARVLYRIHAFISDKRDRNIPAFHVSSFYCSEPVVSYSDLAAKLRDSLSKFELKDLSTQDPSSLELAIGVEEGLWALASATSPGTQQAGAGSGAVFVVLRSTKAAFVLSFVNLFR